MTVSIALIVMGLVSHLGHSAQRARETGPGVITGVVVNAQGEPVADTTVQVFPAPASATDTGLDDRAPVTPSANGQGTTDSQGRFRIGGLPLGDYLVRARASTVSPAEAPEPSLMFVSTFYPSAIDHTAAVRVSAVADATTPIRIALAQVKVASISGRIVAEAGAASPAAVAMRIPTSTPPSRGPSGRSVTSGRSVPWSTRWTTTVRRCGSWRSTGWKR